PIRCGDVVAGGKGDPLGPATFAGADVLAVVDVGSEEVERLSNDVEIAVLRRGKARPERAEAILRVLSEEDRVHPPRVVPECGGNGERPGASRPEDRGGARCGGFWGPQQRGARAPAPAGGAEGADPAAGGQDRAVGGPE